MSTQRPPAPTPSEQPTQEATKRPPQPSPSDDPTPKASERPPPPTPSEQPTQEATKRPPQPSPSDEPTPKASERPPAPSQPQKTPDSTARPTQRTQPSAPPTQRPTVRPAATFLIGGSRSPAPSRWPVPANYTPPATFAAINARIELPNANTTAVTNPANLQQITANIACALRQPLDTIQINNITTRYKNGTIIVLTFDPATAAISSGGAPVCLTGPTATPRRLRLLQATVAEATTVVDYTIVDPSNNLLAMDTSTFNSLIAADPAIISIAAIVGSTGVDVMAPQELDLTAAAPPAPTPGTPTTSNSGIGQNTTIFIAVGITAGAALISIAAAVVAIMARSRSVQVPTTPPLAQKTPVVLFMDTTNPLMLSKSKEVSVLPERSTFEPQGARV